MLGQLIDNRYQVESILGRGGMGTVYRAFDQVEQRPVALKAVNLFFEANTDTALKRFQREFRVLAQLDHPRIVRAYGYGIYQDAPYLILELLEGQTLSQVLSTQGPLPRPQLLLIARQICEALSYLHAKTIVHRDLKPGNLMLVSAGDTPQIKLMDFGLVRAADLSTQLTQEGVALGTMAYIAPEQAQGIPVDFRADLYALGIIMYEMAAGRPPFLHENLAVLLMNQLTQPPPSPRQFNPDLDEPLEQLILQLLAKEPAQRPGSIERLAARLAELSDEKDETGEPMAAGPRPPQKRADLIPRVPLIGRSAALAQITRAWEASRSGSGQVLLLSGPAGVGKTRLLAEASLPARLSSALVLKSHCREHAALPYQPLIEIFEPLARRLAPEQRAVLSPDLGRLLPDLEPPASETAADPAEARLRLFTACCRLVGLSAQSQPLLIAIEDIQWIDPSSLELLTVLIDRIRPVPVLLILSYRPEEIAPGDALATALRSLRQRPGVSSIELELLTYEQIDEFLRVALGRTQLPKWLVESFHLSTNGNPLFIEETLKALAEEGQVADWTRPDAAQSSRSSLSLLTLQLPKTVLALAERRLQQLSAADRMVLTTAAILGPEFSFTLLETVTGQAEDALLDAIDRLLTARLIRELPLRNGDDAYRFTQEALRQALLSTISQRRLRRLHRRTGEAIQRLYDTNQARHWPVLAYHFAEAGSNDQALKYFTLAGDAAAEVYANAEAIAYYSQALELATTAPETAGPVAGRQLIHLYTRRGRCYELLDQVEEAVDNYRQMQQLGQQTQDPALELAALLALATIHVTPTRLRDLHEGRWMAEQALALAEALNDRAGEAKALWNLSLAYKFMEQADKAVEYGEQSLAIARELDLREQIAFVLNDTAWAYRALGRTDLISAYLHEATELWRELGNQPMLADNLGSLAGYYFLKGDLARAQTLATETLQISQSIDNIWNQTQGWMALGHVYMMRGEVTAAIENLTRVIEHSDQGSWMMPQITCRTELGWLYSTLGDIERGIELCREAQVKAGELMPTWRSYPTAMLAWLSLWRGDIPAAEAAIAASQPDLDLERVNLGIVWLHLAKAELALAQQDYPAAVETCDQLAERLARLDVHTFTSIVLHLKGEALLQLGELDAARQTLTDGLALAQAQQARPALWPLAQTLSRLEAAQGNPSAAAVYRQQARQAIQFIANHAPPALRTSFLARPNVRAVLG